jgi:sigma-E factor negative regulatory protein RseC
MTNYAVEQMQEEGVVRSLHGGMAQVESVQTDACATCGARGACHAMGGEKTRVVTALNEADAQVGDKVMLSMPRRAVLSASFLVYMVPVLGLILGAVLGNAYAPRWGWEPQSGAVLAGLAGLAVSWLAVSRLARKLAKHSDFTVRIVRVLKKGATDAVDQCSAGL